MQDNTVESKEQLLQRLHHINDVTYDTAIWIVQKGDSFTKVFAPLSSRSVKSESPQIDIHYYSDFRNNIVLSNWKGITQLI